MSEQTLAGTSSEEETLKELYDQGMKLFTQIEKGNEATNSDAVQMTIRSAIAKFEKATNLVSLSQMFAANENIEELPTETLQYLLLPALLGTLTLKLCRQPRKEVIVLAEIYFRDFIQRCKDYEVTDVELPQTNGEESVRRPQTEQGKIAHMVQTREAKIKRYKESKDLKEKLERLSSAMASPAVDDSTKREYFLTLLRNYISNALDELDGIEQEKPILEYMAKHAGEEKPKQKERATPLRPVIITRDALQKAVYGAGYPSLPTLTIEEFYDKRVKEGTFPGTCSIPHKKIENPDEDADEAEQIRKELLIENEDREELERQRSMDEFKDDHRRGWGNRTNRS